MHQVPWASPPRCYLMTRASDIALNQRNPKYSSPHPGQLLTQCLPVWEGAALRLTCAPRTTASNYPGEVELPEPTVQMTPSYVTNGRRAWMEMHIRAE